MIHRRKNVIAPRSNLMAATKLSDYQIKKIIRNYAYGIPAAQAARTMTVSYQSIRKIYALIRGHMEEVGLYPQLPDQSQFLSSYGREAPPRSPLHAEIARQLDLRRGALASSIGQHISELYFRTSKPPNWTHERYAERHRIDIIRLVQLTAPLNRAIPPESLELARAYLDQRRQAFVEIGQLG